MTGLAEKRLGCLAVLLCISLLASLSAAQTNAVEVRTSDVDTVVASAATREVVLTGYTRARHTMEIVAEESGRCLRVAADVGDTVGKDGIFAQLDTTFVDLAIEQNVVSQRRLQNMIAYYNKDVNRYIELVGRAAAAQATLDGLRNKKDQAAFELQGLKVEKRRLEERRSRCQVKAPPGWSIIERMVEPGEWVSTGQILGRAGDFRTLLVPFAFTPLEYQVLSETMSLQKLTFPDVGEHGMTLSTPLERISPAFDPKTRKIHADLLVAGGLPDMRGGLRAELTLDLPDTPDTVLVPAEALIDRYEESFLVREDGEKVKVTLLGSKPGGTVRVRSSRIKPGDKFRILAK